MGLEKTQWPTQGYSLPLHAAQAARSKGSLKNNFDLNIDILTFTIDTSRQYNLTFLIYSS